jgi:hypothetical protein
MITREISFICSICGESVDVLACVMDERGQAQHEMCYAAKLVRERGARKGSYPSQDATPERLQSPKVA